MPAGSLVDAQLAAAMAAVTWHPCPRCAAPGAVMVATTPCEACQGRAIAAEQRRALIAAGEETIPEGYDWARFDARALPCGAAWAARAKEILQRGSRRRRVTFVGPAGAGKSSLATAMLRDWMRLHGERAEWMHAHALSRARNAHRLGAGEAKLVEQAYAAPLLLVDDVRDDRAGATSTVYDVVQERHARGMPTWVTTGIALDRDGSHGGRVCVATARAAITEAFGDGFARRLFDDVVIDLSGPPPRWKPPETDAATRRAGDR